jgi:hypothetical protein
MKPIELPECEGLNRSRLYRRGIVVDGIHHTHHRFR